MDLRPLAMADIAVALRLGWKDFVAFPTSVFVIALIYPLIGLFLARMLDGMAILPLLFPLAAGFALLGPFAAIFFYGISRAHAAGSKDSFGPVVRSWKAVAVLGGALGLIFVVWLAVAKSIYNSSYGFAPVASMSDFISSLGMAKGQLFLIKMVAAGLPFAAAAFAISVISFPMILDRNCTAADAIITSFRVLIRNPVTMLAWAMTIVVLLLIAMIPAFLGLAIMMPVLGHSSWHLYKSAIGADVGGDRSAFG